MNVTFRQLRLFLALAETGSVSAAAKVMHVTQPTASMQLKEMSLSVGLALYEVIGKKIYLTEVGKELAVTARAVAHTLQRYYASLHQHQTTAPERERMLDFDQLNALIGTPELLATGKRYDA